MEERDLTSTCNCNSDAGVDMARGWIKRVLANANMVYAMAMSTPSTAGYTRMMDEIRAIIAGVAWRRRMARTRVGERRRAVW